MSKQEQSDIIQFIKKNFGLIIMFSLFVANSYIFMRMQPLTSRVEDLEIKETVSTDNLAKLMVDSKTYITREELNRIVQYEIKDPILRELNQIQKKLDVNEDFNNSQ